MPRLIKPNLAAAGKFDPREGTPMLLVNRGTRNAFLRKVGDFRAQIVAHEREFVGATLLGRGERGLRRWRGEDQSAVPRVDRVESNDVA